MEKDNTHEPSKVAKLMVAIFSFIIFGFIGGVIRLFVAPVSLSVSFYEFTLQFLPFILGFGSVSAVLAYMYPRVFGFIMSFLSFFSVGN